MPQRFFGKVKFHSHLICDFQQPVQQNFHTASNRKRENHAGKAKQGASAKDDEHLNNRIKPDRLPNKFRINDAIKNEVTDHVDQDQNACIGPG